MTDLRCQNVQKNNERIDSKLTINKTISIFLLLESCQVPYLFFSTSSGTLSYNTQESSSSPNMVDSLVNALLSFDGANKRLYLYTEPNELRSFNLDGSVSTTVSINNVESFAVDGRNNLIYYNHELNDRIWLYNLTSGQNSAVAALSGVSSVKDLEISMTNG